MHTEISTNILYASDVFGASIEYLNIVTDLTDHIKEGSVKMYPGTASIEDAEPLDLEARVYLSLDEDNFLNKSLLADITHLYTIAENVSNDRLETKEIIESLYKSYFTLWVKNTLDLKDDRLGNDYANINYPLNLSKRYLLSLQGSVRNYKLTSKRVLEFIEYEIEKDGESVDNSRNMSDFYWLSYASIMTSDYKNAYKYAVSGIEYSKTNNEYNEALNNENTSLYGRLNRMAVVAIRRMVSKKTSESTHKIDDVLPYLEAWKKTNVYREQNIESYLDYFNDIDDFDNFCDTLEDLIEILVSSDDPLMHFNDNYAHRISSWSKFMSRDRVQKLLLSSGIPINTWNMYLNP